MEMLLSKMEFMVMLLIKVKSSYMEKNIYVNLINGFKFIVIFD